MTQSHHPMDKMKSIIVQITTETSFLEIICNLLENAIYQGFPIKKTRIPKVMQIKSIEDKGKEKSQKEDAYIVYTMYFIILE